MKGGTSYQSNKDIGTNHERQWDYSVEQSSKISSVVLTDGYSSKASEQPKDSQLNRLAGAIYFNADVEDDHGEKTETVLASARETRQSKMFDMLGHQMKVNLLGQASQGGTRTSSGFRKMQKMISDASVSKGAITGKFSIDYIMHNFDLEKLKMLRTHFRKKQKEVKDGFTLIEFITLIKKVIPYEHPREECDLVHGLITLFKEIDIDDNGFMEWDEFTEFLVEAVDKKQLTTNGRNPGQLHRENALAQHMLNLEETQPDYLHQNNMLQVARSQIYQEFHLSSTFKDKLIRNSPITKAILYHASDSFITLEQGCKNIKLITALSNQAIPSISQSYLQATKVTQQIQMPNPGPNYILSVAFNEKDKIIALCSTEQLIYFYRLYNNQADWKLFKIICHHGTGAQVNMWYMEHHERWFTISSQQQSNYSRKNLKVGAIQTLHQWHIPRSKLLSSKQMVCEECQGLWNRTRGGDGPIEHHIELPYVEYINEDGKKVIDPELRYLVEPFEHMNHRDDVKDVREMYYPFLALITACYDGKMRIISTKQRRVVGILHSGHNTGIRQIDYTPYHGGSLLSVGYESFYNLWEMDNSLSFGKQMQDKPVKFSLNTRPCIAARFLGMSVFSVAIDSQFSIKIWNYKKRTIMQTIQQSKLKMQDQISGLLIFSEGKFAVLSKHITFYDTILGRQSENLGPRKTLKKKELVIRRMILQEKGLSEIKQAAIQQRNNKISPPLDVVFVKSYLNFLVLTKNSLRVYNGTNGRLSMYLDNIIAPDERTGVMPELSSMTLNSEDRMVYVGDVLGGIRCFNVNTGLELTKLELPRGMLQKQGEAGIKCNKEVVDLKFFRCGDDMQYLVSAHWNNRMRVWDVQDTTNICHLRSASAQEAFKEDIQCVAVSEHLSLIATGGTFGTIVTWDFELFKVEQVFVGAKMSLVAMQFVDKFPLLVTASECGLVSVFAVRGCVRGIRAHCLGRFMNVNGENGDYYNSAITGMAIEVVPNPRYNPNEKKLGNLTANVQFYKQQKLAYPNHSDEKDINWYTKSVYQTRLDTKPQEYTTQFGSQSPLDTARTKAKTSDPEEGTFSVLEQDELCQKFFPPFNNRESPEYLNVVISDDAGNVKFLDLTTFIRKPDEPMTDYQLLNAQDIVNSSAPPYLSRIPPYAEQKIGFMPGRHLDTKAGSLAHSLHEIATKQYKMPPILLMARSVQQKVILDAHKGRINNIRQIGVEPYGYVTCGNDKFVRVWSRWGKKMGEINLIKEGTRLHMWKFGYNFKAKCKEEEERAQEIVTTLKLNTINETRTENSDTENELTKEDKIAAFNERIRQGEPGKKGEKKPKPEDVLSFSRPGLDQLVIKPTDSDEETFIEAYYNSKSENDQKYKSPLDKSNKKKKTQQHQQWDVEKLFPIHKTTPTESQAKQLQHQYEQSKRSVMDKAKLIDAAIFKKMHGKTFGSGGNHRQTQSQAAKRSPTNNQKTINSSVDLPKSALRPTLNMNRRNMSHHKTQISFKVDHDDVKKTAMLGQPQAQSATSRFLDQHPQGERAINQKQPYSSPKTQHNVALSAQRYTRSSQSLSNESGAESEQMTPSTLSEQNRLTAGSQSAGIKSKADIKLDAKVKELNSSAYNRLDQLLHKLPGKKTLELTGKSTREIDKASVETKSYKIFEARFEKQSQRSASSISALKDSTERTNHVREKMKNQLSVPNKTAGGLNRSRTMISSSMQDSKIHTGSEVLTVTKQPSSSNLGTFHHSLTEKPHKANISRIKRSQKEQATLETLKTFEQRKHQVIEDVNNRTDDHLQSLIQECEQKHLQMKQFMDEKKGTMMPELKTSTQHITELKTELAEKLSLDDVNKARQAILDDLRSKQEQCRRPPRVQKQDSRSSATSTMGGAAAGGSTNSRSRFLSRVHSKINEQGSDPSLDKRFMMRPSLSSAVIPNINTLAASQQRLDIKSQSKPGAISAKVNIITKSNSVVGFNMPHDQDDQSRLSMPTKHPNQLQTLKLKDNVMRYSVAERSQQVLTSQKSIHTANTGNHSVVVMSRPQSRQSQSNDMGAPQSKRCIQKLIARQVSHKTFGGSSGQVIHADDVEAQMQSVQALSTKVIPVAGKNILPRYHTPVSAFLQRHSYSRNEELSSALLPHKPSLKDNISLTVNRRGKQRLTSFQNASNKDIAQAFN